jgi:4a-hydroxytetrahydrobiopterin dehydratase
MSKTLSNNWTKESDRLIFSLVLKNFMECINLVNKIAELAEEQDHHPDIHLTGYKNLTIEVYTHSKDNLTEKDYELAYAIDALL